MGALCLTVPNFLFRVIFIPAYTNPDKKAYPQKMALMVPKPDYPDLIRNKDRNNAYSATNGSASGYLTPGFAYSRRWRVLVGLCVES